jgi:hypothetical protein
MFGGLGLLVNGNMACGVNGDDLIVRLPPEESTAALTEPAARPFAMTGRPMKGWILIGPEGHAEEGDLSRWVARASPTPSSCPRSSGTRRSPLRGERVRGGRTGSTAVAPCR